MALVYNFNLHEATDTFLKFYFKQDGSTIDLTGCVIYFRITDGTSPLFYDINSSTHHTKITIASDNLVTIHLPKGDFENIPSPEMRYEMDIKDSDDYVKRWLIGSIFVFNGVE